MALIFARSLGKSAYIQKCTVLNWQIQNILESKEVRYNFNILAPQSGTVVARNVSAGDYVQAGQSLFEVADLNQLWGVFDAYESDLPWIQEGDEISFTVESLPGQTFISKITFIDPVSNPQKRVAEVRVELRNNQDELKPQMFAQGVLQSASRPGTENALVIPKTAVLWTGKRAVVYVKEPGYEAPTFAYREIVLGSGSRRVLYRERRFGRRRRDRSQRSIQDRRGRPVAGESKHDESTMKRIELHIKGMVCPRCETVIRQELTKLEARVIAIQPGYATVEAPLALDRSTIADQLRFHGFELLNDPEQQLLEQIKTATLDYLHRRETAVSAGEKVVTLSKFLARTLGRSYSHLSKLFSRYESKTLEQHYISLRVERVKELLDYGELNVSEIAQKLGYSSVHYLSAQFKRVTGQSVSEYRTTQKSVGR